MCVCVYLAKNFNSSIVVLELPHKRVGGGETRKPLQIINRGSSCSKTRRWRKNINKPTRMPRDSYNCGILGRLVIPKLSHRNKEHDLLLRG